MLSVSHASGVFTLTSRGVDECKLRNDILNDRKRMIDLSDGQIEFLISKNDIDE